MMTMPWMLYFNHWLGIMPNRPKEEDYVMILAAKHFMRIGVMKGGQGYGFSADSVLIQPNFVIAVGKAMALKILHNLKIVKVKKSSSVFRHEIAMTFSNDDEALEAIFTYAY